MKAKNQKGFSLIELMIALVIVAILVTVAFPSYQETVKRSRRTDAQAALMNIMAQQERHFTENNTYAASLTSLGYSASSVASGEGYYNISASVCGSQPITDCVLLTAGATGAQASDITECLSITYNSIGVKSDASGATSGSKCW